MPKYGANSLDRVFQALSDSTRRGIVERLVARPASTTELARPLAWALPTVVQHLSVLESAGIATSAKHGRVRTYQLVPDAFAPAADWLGEQRIPAERRLDRLETLLTEQPN